MTQLTNDDLAQIVTQLHERLEDFLVTYDVDISDPAIQNRISKLVFEATVNHYAVMYEERVKDSVG